MLEELGVPYDCVLIDLAAKPDWYPALVPTTKARRGSCACVEGRAAPPTEA